MENMDPRKDTWFIDWLEDKFKRIEELIEVVSSNAVKERQGLEKRMTAIDEKHDAKHKNTRRLIAASVVFGSFLWIKESRDIIIAFISKLVGL